MAFNNDMTMMFVVHDALRRELGRIADVTARIDDDPQHILRTAAGWEMFKTYLHVHHSSEDEQLWPPLRESLSVDSDATALLDALEAEHAAIDPLIGAIDAALSDAHCDPARLGELTDALATGLRRHLDHEEKQGLPVIDKAITAAQWQAFSAAGAQLVSDDLSRFMPWVFEGALPEVTAAMLDRLPPPLQRTYREQWQPAYAAMPLWA
jgi:iron-sulfur cluster repair protein YtfE (RIC family)